MTIYPAWHLPLHLKQAINMKEIIAKIRHPTAAEKYSIPILLIFIPILKYSFFFEFVVL